MILLIDNYDSFTYNLYQYIGSLGEEVRVVRNDKISLEEVKALRPLAIIISPGPGRPEEAGISIPLVKEFYKSIPILGICLGHQAIVRAFGGQVLKAKTTMHGKVSAIAHNGSELFRGLPEKLKVMRYHSLAAQHDSFPATLAIDAVTEADGEIMALSHVDYPVFGLQFHPESIGTLEGLHMIENFIRISKREEDTHERVFA